MEIRIRKCDNFTRVGIMFQNQEIFCLILEINVRSRRKNWVFRERKEKQKQHPGKSGSKMFCRGSFSLPTEWIYNSVYIRHRPNDTSWSYSAGECLEHHLCGFLPVFRLYLSDPMQRGSCRFHCKCVCEELKSKFRI